MIDPPRLLKIFPALTYRIPMPVWQLMIFPNALHEDSHYLCPRCGLAIDREFMVYCDRCGQHLEWALHAQAKIVYPGTQKLGVRTKKS